jgi:hypothetical protein
MGQFLGQATDIFCPETDKIGQFLGQETDIMVVRYYIAQLRLELTSLMKFNLIVLVEIQSCDLWKTAIIYTNFTFPISSYYFIFHYFLSTVMGLSRKESFAQLQL